MDGKMAQYTVHKYMYMQPNEELFKVNSHGSGDYQMTLKFNSPRLDKHACEV